MTRARRRSYHLEVPALRFCDRGQVFVVMKSSFNLSACEWSRNRASSEAPVIGSKHEFQNFVQQKPNICHQILFDPMYTRSNPMRNCKSPGGLMHRSMIFLLFACPLSAAPPAAQPARTTKNTASSSNSIYCGLWRADSGFQSTIQMRNRLVIGPTTATPCSTWRTGPNTTYRRSKSSPAEWLR